MEPGELNPDTRYGTLTVNSASCFTSGWCIYDMSAVMDDAELRGANRLLPHASGTLARRRRRTLTRKNFPMAFTGLYDASNHRIASRSARPQQLIDNFAAFRAAIGIAEDAPAGVAGTVTAVWTQPSGATKSATVHVISPFQWQLKLSPVATAVLVLELPDGRFA